MNENSETNGTNGTNETDENREDMLSIWKKRKSRILFWSVVAVALLIAILFQSPGQ